ncbi:MAG: PAS domain-containing protein [Flavobacteriaceae bacterium]|nr:PAS domain-containing protein [Flavobacteriaceae bacterium]
MSSKEIEIILSGQWADSLSVPVFIVDTMGNLLFYNEPAEEILGLRFEETGSTACFAMVDNFYPYGRSGSYFACRSLASGPNPGESNTCAWRFLDQ